MDPLFLNPKTTLELQVLYMIVISKNSGHYLSFVGHLKIGFSVLQWWKSIVGFIPSSIDIAKNEKILQLCKNAHVQSAKKYTSRCPTKMFDPSKNRY